MPITPDFAANPKVHGITAQHDGRDTLTVTASMKRLPANYSKDLAEKIHALVFLMTGDGQEHFESADVSVRENALWLLAGLTDEMLSVATLAADIEAVREDEAARARKKGAGNV